MKNKEELKKEMEEKKRLVKEGKLHPSELLHEIIRNKYRAEIESRKEELTVYKKENTKEIKTLPPRHIDFLTKLGIYLGNDRFSSLWFPFIFLFIFSMLFISVDFTSELEKYFYSQSTKGIVTKVYLPSHSKHLDELSPSSIDKNKMNYQYDYSFKYWVNNDTLESVYKSTYIKNIRVGSIIDVKHDKNKPEKVRIVNENSESNLKFILILSLVLIMLFVIFIIRPIFLIIKESKKIIYLLEYGKAVKGQNTNEEEKLSYIDYSKLYSNKRTAWKKIFVFEFEERGRKYLSKYKGIYKPKINDEIEEIILFDERNPESNIIYDSINYAPEILPDGTLSKGSLTNLKLIAYPIFFILLIAALYYYFHVIDSMNS